MAQVGRMVKEASIQEFSVRLSERPNFFVTAVNRLPAAETDNLRQKLHASHSRLVVIKRSLGLRALEQLKIPGLENLLDGSVGFVLSGEDILQTAKLIVEFHKKHEEQLTVRGAVIDGQLLDTSRVEELAQLPPKPMLLAQVVATIESPIIDVIFTLERLIGDLSWVVEQVAAGRGSPNAESGGTTPEPPPTPEGQGPTPQAPETPGTPTQQT